MIYTLNSTAAQGSLHTCVGDADCFLVEIYQHYQQGDAVFQPVVGRNVGVDAVVDTGKVAASPS